MNFKEALEALKKGSRIRRPLWTNSLHLVMIENAITPFERLFVSYEYDASIFTSDDWIDFDNPRSKPVDFYEAIIAMAGGFKVTRKDWDKDVYLTLDSNKSIIISKMIHASFVPSALDILANDWISE